MKSKELFPLIPTKSSLMIGIGETLDEILQTMNDLRKVDCDILSLGQDLQPTKQHLEVVKYYSPAEFQRLKEEGEERGFKHVESGPLVRSSYYAHEQTQALRVK